VTEDELRALVRDAIARHVGAGAPDSRGTPTVGSEPFTMIRQHASHALFAVPAGADTGGPCVIEPAVACNHCGYCKSFGH
jgi:hypothetical protein